MDFLDLVNAHAYGNHYASGPFSFIDSTGEGFTCWHNPDAYFIATDPKKD